MTVEEVYRLIEVRNKRGISDSLFQAIASNEPLIWLVEVGAETKEGKIHDVVLIDSDENICYPETKDILKCLRTNYPHWIIDWFRILAVGCSNDLQDGEFFPTCVCRYYDLNNEPEMF